MQQPSADIIKQKIQTWIVTISIVLLGGKFLAFMLTNSVGILTDAMESIVNVAAGFISLYSLRMAAKPKDEGHPFGHGKVELISASIEGILIILAGGVIIYEGVRRIFEPTMPEKLDIGIVVIALAGLVNYIMGWYSIKVGKKYNSMALIAGGKHLQSDTYSTIGLVAGLILLYITRLSWIDSALAMVFGAIIVYTGFSILRNTVENLMDKADVPLLQKMLDAINAQRKADWIDIHNLKMIKYGSYYYIDCDLTMPWYYNIKQGHDQCDNLKSVIVTHFSERATVSIHSDSCDGRHCTSCSMSLCQFREYPFTATHTITLAEFTESDDERNTRLNKNK